ncbi:hypothetical protein [Streptomyces humicola]|nr:hypothetical protein [Streptomyces humicola]
MTSRPPLISPAAVTVRARGRVATAEAEPGQQQALDRLPQPFITA